MYCDTVWLLGTEELNGLYFVTIRYDVPAMFVWSGRHNHGEFNMKLAILITGALALAATAPLSADPGKSKKNGQGNSSHSTMKHGGSKANGRADRTATNRIVRTDRNGRLFALDARGDCPPGLAKKNNGCSPPGQAKKQYDVGQRYNTNFGNMWGYNQIPNDLRSQYNLNPSDDYYYNQGYLYQVDQRSNLVERVISTLLR